MRPTHKIQLKDDLATARKASHSLLSRNRTYDTVRRSLSSSETEHAGSQGVGASHFTPCPRSCSNTCPWAKLSTHPHGRPTHTCAIRALILLWPCCHRMCIIKGPGSLQRLAHAARRSVTKGARRRRLDVAVQPEVTNVAIIDMTVLLGNRACWFARGQGVHGPNFPPQSMLSCSFGLAVHGQCVSEILRALINGGFRHANTNCSYVLASPSTYCAFTCGRERGPHGQCVDVRAFLGQCNKNEMKSHPMS